MPSAGGPTMTKRRKLWLLSILLVLAISAPLIPGSPVYLSNLLYSDGRSYDNHSAGYWIKTLDSPNARDRHQAVFALGAIGSEAPDAVPAIARRMLEDDDRDIRSASALALLKMVPVSRAAVAELAQALSDSYDHVRM